jgi:hypothetical protein
MDDVDVLPSQLIASPSIEDYDDDDDDVVDIATSPYWVLASANVFTRQSLSTRQRTVWTTAEVAG